MPDDATLMVLEAEEIEIANAHGPFSHGCGVFHFNQVKGSAALTHKVCIVCGKEKHSIVCEYVSPDQYELAVGVDNKDYYRAWVRCSGCGLHSSIFSRGKHDLDKLYLSGYRCNDAPWRQGASVEQVFSKVTKLQENESVTKKKVRWIKENMNQVLDGRLVIRGTPPLKFLDVGGANGVFAYEFKDENWQAFVADPSTEGKFVERFGIHYTQAYYQPGLFKNKFNLISLNCVLEHLESPIDILKIAKGDLDENGFLYVEIPDAVHFDLYPKEDDIFNSCHLWMFDPMTLSRILFDAGFQIYSLTRIRLPKGIGLWALAGHK